MLQLTEKQILNKYKTLPSKLKEVLELTSYFEKIENIGKRFDLSRDDIDVLTAAVGHIFLGFLLPQNLFKEINDYLEAEEKIVVEVIRETNRRILFPLHEELEKLYQLPSHIEETVKIEEIKKLTPLEKKEEKVISLEELGAPTKPVEQKIEVKVEEKPSPPTEGKPFILHKEKPIAEEKKTFSRPFSLPFKIFQTKPKPEPAPPVRVKLEGLGEQPPAEKKKPTIFKKETPQKIVHYSELRTPLEPFGAPPESTKPEEIINLETFQPEIKRDTNIPTTQPKLEGNTVDLRNNSQ